MRALWRYLALTALAALRSVVRLNGEQSRAWDEVVATLERL